MQTHQLYVLCIWLHLLAMATWLGSMVALAAVVMPVLRSDGPAAVGRFLAGAARRLRVMGWTCLAILGLTGWAQLHLRGMAWNANLVITSKVTIYFVIVLISLWHDFRIGPAASAALRDAPDGPRTASLRRDARRAGQMTLLLALTATFLGVVISRGSPW